jgi:hypothetical protein
MQLKSRTKNITLSADGDLIEQARQEASGRGTTLNQAFREWLQTYTAQQGNGKQYDDLMKRLRGHVRPGRRFSRDEMNEH